MLFLSALHLLSKNENSKSLGSHRLCFLGDNVFAIECFEKGCPTEKPQSVRDNTERHDGLWLLLLHRQVHEFSARWKAVL